MPSYRKFEPSGTSLPNDNKPKDVKDLKTRTRKDPSLLLPKNDFGYSYMRGIKTKLKMYPKNVSKTPSVLRIDEESASYQSSGSSNATVRINCLF